MNASFEFVFVSLYAMRYDFKYVGVCEFLISLYIHGVKSNALFMLGDTVNVRAGGVTIYSNVWSYVCDNMWS